MTADPQRGLLLVCAIVLALASCVFAQNRRAPTTRPAEQQLAPADRELLEKVAPCVVLFRDVGMKSTGIVIDSDGTILTSAAVAFSPFPQQLVAIVETRGVRKAVVFDRFQVTGFNLRSGQALIKVDAGVGRLIPARLARERPTAGQPCVLVAAAEKPNDASGLAPLLEKGIISSPKRKVDDIEVLQTDVKVPPGGLGGGIFDRTGALHAVITISLSERDGLGFGVPMQDFVRDDFKPMSERPVDKQNASKVAKLARVFVEVASTRENIFEWGYFLDGASYLYRLALMMDPDSCDIIMQYANGTDRAELKNALFQLAEKHPQITAGDWLVIGQWRGSDAKRGDGTAAKLTKYWRNAIQYDESPDHGTQKLAIMYYLTGYFNSDIPSDAHLAYGLKWLEKLQHGGGNPEKLRKLISSLGDEQESHLNDPDIKYSCEDLDRFVAMSSKRVAVAPPPEKAAPVKPPVSPVAPRPVRPDAIPAPGPDWAAQLEELEKLAAAKTPFPTGCLEVQLPERSQATRLARGGCYLVCQFADLKLLSVFNIATGGTVCHIPAPGNVIWAAGNKVLLVWSDQDMTLTTYDIETGKAIRSVITPGNRRARLLVMSPYRDDIAVGQFDHIKDRDDSPRDDAICRVDLASLGCTVLRPNNHYELVTALKEGAVDQKLTAVGSIVFDGPEVRLQESRSDIHPLHDGQVFVCQNFVIARDGTTIRPEKKRMSSVFGAQQCVVPGPALTSWRTATLFRPDGTEVLTMKFWSARVS